MKRILQFVALSLVAFSLQGQTAGTLTVSATTSATASAEYVTKNVVAIWVEDANNKFVKSLLVMANVRKGDLFVMYSYSKVRCL